MGVQMPPVSKGCRRVGFKRERVFSCCRATHLNDQIMIDSRYLDSSAKYKM